MFKSSSNSGSSGAPLLTKDGFVLGMNVGNFCDIEKEENLNFPVNDLYKSDVHVDSE